MSLNLVTLLLFSVIIKIMLEKFAGKFEKNTLFDAHFHYAVCVKEGVCDVPDVFNNRYNWQGLSCAHFFDEWEVQNKASESVLKAYGLHPQSAKYIDLKQSADFLEKLLQAKLVSFIGEAGFDYFTPELRETAEKQEEMWNVQLDLALKYKLPLVVHCRKANHKLFEYSKQLKKLPEVLFHSFMGPPVEVQTLLKRDINAFFSFGKQLFNGNKKAIACVKELPLNCLLAETDAPFQTLKGQDNTRPSEIFNIIEEIKRIRYI